MTGEANHRDAERIYRLWDDALGKKDLEASLSLYADDASIESPLVQHLMKTKEGVVQGKDNLRKFIALVFQTNPAQRKRFRTGFFSDGRMVTWEYPRVAPEGDQMELVEVMEIEHGLIRRHLLGLVCAQCAQRRLAGNLSLVRGYFYERSPAC
jgi:predicted SnoaL-like aldol condensation-catalyzing enzyme